MITLDERTKLLIQQGDDPQHLKRKRESIENRRDRYNRLTAILERGLDVSLSFIALCVFGPLMFVTAVWVKIQDGGPVLFRQTRVGKEGRCFQMLKFRSMRVDADKIKEQLMKENHHNRGVTFKLARDPRITKAGRFIRKYSIDELPQLINVLNGEMSLVGPRPAVPSEVVQYKSSHLLRLKLKPGITGIWQVSGRANVDFDGQVEMDREYYRKHSFGLYLTLLLKTIPAVLHARGSY